MRVTHLLESPNCAPGNLDILLLPGSEAFTPTENVLKFVQGHSAAQGTAILAICTGTFTGAHAGIFDGKIATGPRAFYEELRQQFPLVKWVDRRWARDGNVWSSGKYSRQNQTEGSSTKINMAFLGNITNGMDMVMAFIKHRWPGVLSQTVVQLSDAPQRADTDDS